MSTDGSNEPLEPDGDKPSKLQNAGDMASTAVSAGKEIAKGAATGGAGGAAKAVFKSTMRTPQGRKLLVAAILAVVGTPIILVVAMSLLISSLYTSAANTKTSIDMSLRQTVAAVGFSEDEMKAIIQASSDHDLPWEMMAAVLDAQRLSFDGKGPFHIQSKSAGSVGGRNGANDLTSSAQYVASKLQGLAPPAGVNLNLDIGSGATIYASKTILWANEEQHISEVVDPWAKAVKGLPLAGATTAWAQAIVEQAVKWRLGVVDCAAAGFSISGEWVQPTVDADGIIHDGNDYGWRVDPVNGSREFHAGDDLGNVHGTPIWAAAAGTVVRVGYSSGTGNMIKLDHSGGIATEYFHMDDAGPMVKVGDKVTIGQQIGVIGDYTTGRTGHSTADHLHFEVLINGKTTDPYKFFAQHGLKLTDKPPMADGAAPPSGAPGTGELVIANGKTAKFRTGVGTETIEFSKVMLQNAQTIANTINTMVPQKGTWTQTDRERLFLMAIEAGMVESTMGSNNGWGGNNKHVGIFQQSRAVGWYADGNSEAENEKLLHDVVLQVNNLVQGHDKSNIPGLVDVKDWRSDKTGDVVQATERGGAGGAGYQKWEALAKAVLAGLNGTLTGANQAGCTEGGQLTVVMANIIFSLSASDYKADLVEATKSEPDVVAIDEAGPWKKEIVAFSKNNGYTVANVKNWNTNAIIFKSSLGSIISQGIIPVCPREGPGGISVRTIAWVTLSMGSQQLTVINTHAPPTIESGGKPDKNAIDSRLRCMTKLMTKSAALAKAKAADGGQVIFEGDLNVNYPKDKKVQSKNFPYAQLEHNGDGTALRSQYSSSGLQDNGTEGNRYIDYVYYWVPGSTLTPTGYKIDTNTNSDHDFVVATFSTGIDDLGGGDMAAVIAFALKYEKEHHNSVQYSWGGGGLNGPSNGFGRGAGINGFDCSSWTRFAVYQGTGKDLTLPRTAAAQAAWAQKKGYAVRLHDWTKVKAGDLVFYAYGRGTGHIYHVALAIGGGKIIEEPGGISSRNPRARYIQINNLSPDRQPQDIWGVARIDLSPST